MEMEAVQEQVVGGGGLPPPQVVTSVTVSGSHRDTEIGVVGQQQWEEIRQRHAVGKSVSAIARELGLDRKTVRSCLKRGAWTPYQRTAPRPSMLDAHREWLEARAPQVAYSARILYQELRMQHGYSGCYELVKVAVRPLRAASTVASVTQMRFETAPGEQAQVDWGQVSVTLGGVRVKVHVFVMTLGYSRRGYAEGYLNERMASLLSAHERAFEHFGGSCQTLLYDRMRTVVAGLIEDGSRARLNDTFSAFADHWGYTVRLCRPYRAKTKGKVESGVKYVKGNFVPGRSFVDLDDFNAQLAAWQAEIADVRVHGTTHQRPIDRFADEARALIPYAGRRSFLQAMVRERKVAEDWLVSIEANRYSVPFGLIGKTVQVTLEGEQWVIRYGGKVVAEHPVLAGRAQLSVRPEHGPGALPRRQRQRFAQGGPRAAAADANDAREVQVRDLDVYEQLLDGALREAA
jgi:transposase